MFQINNNLVLMNVAATYWHLLSFSLPSLQFEEKVTTIHILSFPRPFVRLGKVCKVWIWLHYCFLWLFRQWKVSKELVFFLLSLSHFHCLTNLYLLLPQALTKDRPMTNLILQCILHYMFWLAPWSYGILFITEWKILHHKRRQLWGQLSLSLTKLIVITHKRRGKRLRVGGCLTKLVGSSYLYTLI